MHCVNLWYLNITWDFYNVWPRALWSATQQRTFPPSNSLKSGIKLLHLPPSTKTAINLLSGEIQEKWHCSQTEGPFAHLFLALFCIYCDYTASICVRKWSPIPIKHSIPLPPQSLEHSSNIVIGSEQTRRLLLSHTPARIHTLRPTNPEVIPR